MSKKIVIDKERIEFILNAVHLAYGQKLRAIKELTESAAEIDTDQSIEERAKKFYPPQTTDFICSPKLVRDAYIKGATEQDLISKVRLKEMLYNKISQIYLLNEVNMVRESDIDEIFNFITNDTN